MHRLVACKITQPQNYEIVIESHRISYQSIILCSKSFALDETLSFSHFLFSSLFPLSLTHFCFLACVSYPTLFLLLTRCSFPLISRATPERIRDLQHGLIHSQREDGYTSSKASRNLSYSRVSAHQVPPPSTTCLTPNLNTRI